MAIVLRCKCKTEMKISAKKCKNCNTVFGKKKTYKVILRFRGRKVTRTVSNLTLAKEVEAKLKTDITRGEHDLSKKKSAPNLDSVWKKYLPWAMENKKSWQTDKYYYEKHLQPSFGNKSLEDISPFDIEKLIIKMKKGKNKRGKPYAMATIRHQIVLLSRLYSLADKWNLYSGVNPCSKVKKPKLNNRITEFMSDDELLRLYSVLDNWPDKMSVSIIKFALCTGIRRGEIFKLQWKDIDLIKGTITLRSPKGGQDKLLPLSQDAIKVINNVPKDFKTTWVFYGRNGQQRTNFKGPWLRIREKAKLGDFRFHGLRHHFASALASSGKVDLYTIQQLLTHKDPSTTQRYAHLADQTLRKAVNLSDNLLKPQKQLKVIKMEK
jgi:integrase